VLHVAYYTRNPVPAKDGDAAWMFLCAQRAHHQALEWAAPFMVMSLFGAMTAPLSVAFAGVLW